MALTQDLLVWGLRLLGIADDDFAQVRNAQTRELAESALADLKARAKTAYRSASKKLHPDLNNNDPDKTEQFRALTEVVEYIEKLKVHARRPVQIRFGRIFVRVR